MQEIHETATRAIAGTPDVVFGNPSYSDWTWEVSASDAQVTVTWDVYLKTFDRKLLAGPIRQRQLRKEVAASLRAPDEATAVA